PRPRHPPDTNPPPTSPRMCGRKLPPSARRFDPRPPPPGLPAVSSCLGPFKPRARRTLRLSRRKRFTRRSGATLFVKRLALLGVPVRPASRSRGEAERQSKLQAEAISEGFQVHSAQGGIQDLHPHGPAVRTKIHVEPLAELERPFDRRVRLGREQHVERVGLLIVGVQRHGHSSRQIVITICLASSTTTVRSTSSMRIESRRFPLMSSPTTSAEARASRSRHSERGAVRRPMNRSRFLACLVSRTPPS